MNKQDSNETATSETLFIAELEQVAGGAGGDDLPDFDRPVQNDGFTTLAVGEES